ncbi:MAG: exopolysaccharide biosynthesis polyprenyl glycosylphosphotransferase [Rhodospirillales bacterium]|nr:exopolysaccharide biosynthesis polyprenyl glycosylphosphotransferase [Rhodospirillales bacterium]
MQVRLVPEPFTFEIPPHLCAPAGEIPGMQLLRLADPPIELRGQIVKTLFDKCAALAALLLFGPLMLACAAIIKITSPGPVLFQQPRVGLRNRTFMMYKFRSMHMKDCGHSVLTSRNDSRIFPFGHILRKLSLDELPQLFNVLKGDMSMVGPRPHMPQARAAGALYYDIVPDYAARHRVKPGITGWAQVNGWRGPTETVEQIENRVRYDIYYVENWSLWLDVKILFRTAKVGFFGKNAF